MQNISERLLTFVKELEAQCDLKNCYEFEYYVEIWSAFYWFPWFIDVNGESLTFSANDISRDDLDWLENHKFLEIIKIYEKSEARIELERRRYKLLWTKNNSPNYLRE